MSVQEASNEESANSQLASVLLQCFEAWQTEQGQKPITLVVGGKPGVGKSTLVNSFLGENVAEAKPSAAAVTSEPVLYSGTSVHGFPLQIIDTPGFSANEWEGNSTTSELADIEKLSVIAKEAGADLLLFCCSLAQRFDSSDFHNVEILTACFGKEIWSHAVLVLSNADVIENETSTRLDETMESFILKFQIALQKVGCTTLVSSVYSFQPNESLATITKLRSKQAYSGIIGLPVSKVNIPDDWKSALLAECFRVCKGSALPGFMQVKGLNLVLEVKKTGRENKYNLVLRALGTSAGIAIGGAIGAVLGPVKQGVNIGAFLGGAVVQLAIQLSDSYRGPVNETDLLHQIAHRRDIQESYDSKKTR